jgi:hypothetical protein
MSEMETTPKVPMPHLFAALAALQANLPRIAKDADATIPGKDGKQGYAYKYADLTDIADALMPMLGKNGLAFTAKPTLSGGVFVLEYSLVHESGESDGGFYPLPDPGRTPPQQVGSAITYARRYCLCAVTGVAPGGDDDDAGAAQAGYQSAGAAFDTASPVRPQAGRQQQPRGDQRPQGQVSRPAAAGQTRLASGEADPDAQKYADTASQTRTLAELEQIHKDAMAAQKLSALIKAPESGNLGKLAVYLDWRRKLLADLDKAWKELDSAQTAARVDVTELEVIIKQETGADADHASAAQLFQVAAKLRERAA